MPLIASKYKPPLLFKNGHLSTIYAGVFRKVDALVQKRERITLPDSDFLDLDWSFGNLPSKKVTIILHGLEGNAQRPYIAGSAKQFNLHNIDVCAVNFRGCSGEANRLFRSYHSGATEDLEAVIQHILKTKDYQEIYLHGFSLGGNLALKYLGERQILHPAIKGAVAVSVPCDLHDSLQQLLLPKNALYAHRFKKRLLEKLHIKQELFPDKISITDISKIKNLKDFDDVYTSRAHGFKNALDYYTKASCLPFLKNISIPTLIINSKNDSFLGKECYPYKEAAENDHLFLEIPKYGGHVGFFGKDNTSYTEKRAVNFLFERNLKH
ncbi:YheT family hydrolase [Cellulophaga sp. Hel_I_12]|uniref:YheT family hydrolase n=1 Tax=Cellulophaga sp. Hel_I_12 TaxID=1249972 RepID=UPI0006455687|nr:alpha/beta fold hydrolase [Cellulophaga sp. Hel_I_12]